MAVARIALDESAGELAAYGMDGGETGRTPLPAGGGGGGSSNIAWLPDVDADGDISWTRSASTTPPTPQNIKGPPGEQGPTGLAGDNGWTPVPAIVNDGERRVIQVIDWAGGSGTKPQMGLYVGAAGLVANIADAINILGPEGYTNGARDWAEVYVAGRPTIEILERYGFAQIPLSSIRTSSSDKFSAYDGGVKIGAGVSRVKVNASVVFLTFPEAGEFGITLSLNHIPESTADSGFCKQLNYFKPPFCSFAVTPKIIDVVEGDVIYFSCYSGSIGPGNVIGDNGTATYVTVEEVL